MIEIRGDKKVLVTPVSKEDLADIKIGDIVWLDGDLMTCRDVAHRRLVEYGRELPYDIRNKNCCRKSAFCDATGHFPGNSGTGSRIWHHAVYQI